MAYELEQQTAVKAVLLAAQLCQQVRQTIRPEAIEKKDRSPVTVADYGSQAMICRLLAEVFPQDLIVAEEDAAALSQPEMAPYLAQVCDHLRQMMPDATPELVTGWINQGNGQVAPRYWTLDPIDGTKGFLRGEQYAVALALVEAGEVKLGVLACPAFAASPEASADPDSGSLFVAVRGQGATVAAIQGANLGEALPAQVVQPNDPANFRFVESVESGHGDHAQQEAVAQAVGIKTDSIRMDSQAKYAAVASGQAALYLRLPSPKTPDYREKIWDHAAGVIVVEEAGGKVTDMRGKPLDFGRDYRLLDNQGVVVSNGSCHEAAIAALASLSR
ncbi:MAG: 3'(2'),5'-bisphosphate nucleotidase [Pegethrix bostrychoides GSE-TBD4-15B]|jgi:3'(2'), 5'-bisphosphate nucleotidase|uniref:3'(2'),5'-bisphosphate nucleotidase n=1 Tax=Pegethrix bostrychoides GSE-TBD4-15B TaxID=2839662 RepID=A0A951U756_9CYAN|nr:3'(2'),5'-bisphosphate nucleotidase [Pegethrix bostrychoides GSE-TBD4-15B]